MTYGRQCKLSLQTLFSKWIRGAHRILRCKFWSADKLPTTEHSASTGARKLPEDRSTPFLRLLGRGRTQRRAPAELKALSDDDYENNVALPLLIRYRLELASAPLSQADEEFLMNTQETYAILLLRVKFDCKRDGERKTVLRQLRRKFVILNQSGDFCPRP